ncbi:MAG: zinc ribbon domain-containing protein [Solirubrobacterales bacterium]
MATMTPAIFGITNGTINAIVSLLVLSMLAMWMALIYWSFKDAERRIEDPVLMRAFPLWSVFPFVGTVIYSIIRPPEYLEDVREREVETKSAEARLAMLQNRTCRNCGYEVEPSYLRCPSCLRKLREPCETCNKPLDPRWRICPFCESEVKRAAPAPARRRRPVRAAEPARPTERAASKRTAPTRPAAAAPDRAASSAAERQQRSLASVKGDGPSSRNSDSDAAPEVSEPAKAAKPDREAKQREAKREAEPAATSSGRLSAAAAIGPPSPGSGPEAPDPKLPEADQAGSGSSKASGSAAKRRSAKRAASGAKKPSSGRTSRNK